MFQFVSFVGRRIARARAPRINHHREATTAAAISDVKANGPERLRLQNCNLVFLVGAFTKIIIANYGKSRPVS